MVNFVGQLGGYGSATPQQYLNQGYNQGYGPEAGYIIEEPAHHKPQHRTRMRMNIVAIFISLFFPWLLYTALFATVSFRLHYKVSSLCWAVVGLAALLVIYIGAKSVRHVLLMNEGHAGYTPTWLMFLFLTSLVAVFAGPIMGDTNFWENMQPYYSLQNLNDYSAVDPTRMRGQQMMDAGRVQFSEGATLDLSKAYAFQNLDTYCVAPITMSNPKVGGPVPLASYDFWAVGINCCSGNTSKTVNFKCGPYKSDSAREGLRLMADEPRAFLRLAVQQAESAHMIKAEHPLFFYWSNDALGDMHSYLEKAYRNFAIGMCGFFAAQMALVLILSYVLSKIGHSNL